jgi:hypothetical protein
MNIKDTTMKRIRKRYRRIRINRTWIILAALLWIISFIVNINFWAILFLSIFCVANAIVLSIDRYVEAPVDIELSTFSAILMTTEYGWQWGVAAAVMTKFAAIIYNKNIRVDHFFMIGGYVLAALSANLFPTMHIVTLGILVTLIVNFYVFMVSKFITMLSNYEIIMYGTSNILFNFVMFMGFSQLFQTIMV